MAAYETRLRGSDGAWIRVGDLATSDGYWAYTVLDIWGSDLVFGVGMPQGAQFYRRVDPAEVDAKGRIVSEENTAGERRARQWIEEQNRKNAHR